MHQPPLHHLLHLQVPLSQLAPLLQRNERTDTQRKSPVNPLLHVNLLTRPLLWGLPLSATLSDGLSLSMTLSGGLGKDHTSAEAKITKRKIALYMLEV